MYRGGKKQPCRNFMRGSCHYGDQCKFLHSVNINQQQQQQSMPSNNPFGFGKLASQQSKPAPSGFASIPKQQNQFKPFENKWTRDSNNASSVAKQSNDPPPSSQPANHTCTDPNACKRLIADDFQHERPLWKPSCYGHFKYNNPFGFGKLASQQSKPAPSGFASIPKQQNQFKPFENKWTRDSNNASSVAKQSNDPPPSSQPANHTCTDPNACKRLIADDFQHERPLWKPSCYGHFKYLPCDIRGDISPEELRAMAYDDGKKGMSLLAIVERERNIVNSKLIEYENLLHNPYVISPQTSTFPGVNVHPSPATVQNNVPPPVSSFSQLGMLTNQGSKPSAVVSSSGNFGQQNPFSVTSQTPGFSNNPTFGSQGLFGNQQQMQPHGNASTVNTSLGFGNLTASVPNPFQSANVATNQEHMKPHGNASAFNIPFGNNFAVTSDSSSSAASVQSPFGHNVASSLGGQTNLENSPDGIHGDMSIWLKEQWNPGEIPEEAPPAGYCF
ncbi:Zinc finger ccch domain-containing protein [Thalictrum thalictroides]|uniref:Zinc finger ccch domain-containing protein n=1 Tax=Thalictrum thalictroides TaxID=46969 RepID=A0A7J6WU94_THATH|nr:Zinc finger ccch domain-containing protein [Thalictrum thalictroides]